MSTNAQQCLQQLGLTNNVFQLQQKSQHQFRLREFWAAVEYIMIFCNLVKRLIAMGDGRSFPNRFNAWTLAAIVGFRI